MLSALLAQKIWQLVVWCSGFSGSVKSTCCPKLASESRLVQDVDGKPIQAHGGSVLEHEGVFYWFGEHKGGTTYFSHTIGWDPYPSRHSKQVPALHEDPDTAFWACAASL